MQQRFISEIAHDRGPSADDSAWWFVFRGAEILLADAPEPLPRGNGAVHDVLQPLRANYLGLLDGQPVYALEIDAGAAIPDGYSFQGLRSLFGRVPDELFILAGRAAQIVEWDRTHLFCGRCGTPTVYAPNERAKRCPNCGLLSFPRLSPAVITLVQRGDSILLARGVNFAEGMYSVLAGFVEPGESLENAVAREIEEEVGIQVSDVTYFGSQPWPFPHSLMIGFTATYAGGEIAIDPREIADAGWYTYPDLPKIPQKLSIARQLIDSYVARHGPPLDLP
jgi:NAD+ diphosphatase